jgi:hypothetical protein
MRDGATDTRAGSLHYLASVREKKALGASQFDSQREVLNTKQIAKSAN